MHVVSDGLEAAEVMVDVNQTFSSVLLSQMFHCGDVLELVPALLSPLITYAAFYLFCLQYPAF